MRKVECFSYKLPATETWEFPKIKRELGCQIKVLSPSDLEVEIVGNKDGLLFLAKHLIALAFKKNKDGMHIHLEPSEKLDPTSKELTICNSDLLPVENNL